MKWLSVETLKIQEEGRLEVAGRCWHEDILLGDELHCSEVLRGRDGRPLQGPSRGRVKVTRISVNNRDVECLYRGYVGTLFLQLLEGEAPPLQGALTRSDDP